MNTYISEKEFQLLKGRETQLEEERRELSQRLGDIASESSSDATWELPEYLDVENKIQTIQGQVARLRKKIAEATVISDVSALPDGVSVYTEVSVKSKKTGEKATYYISHVPTDAKGVIALTPEAPLAQALTGHRKGDTVHADMNGMPFELEIIDLAKRL